MADLKGKIILVVDDELGLREILREELQFLNASVREAEDAEAAIKIILTEKLDAIISDYQMPLGGGAAILKTCQSQALKIPIFILSGITDTDESELYASGVAGIFYKPCDLNLLLDKLSLAFKAVPL